MIERFFMWGIVAHIVADWFLQNAWMSDNKTSLRHAAAYVHSGIHLACFLFVFPFWIAFLLALAHILIDTRKPLLWWGRLLRQTAPESGSPAYIPFAMWRDQMAHVLCLALAAWAAWRVL